MAKANAKKRAEENTARITLLFRLVVGAVATFVCVRLGLRRASVTWWFHYPVFGTTASAAWFCYRSLEYHALPSYDQASGALVDGGGDLTLSGMSSYYHDIIYIAVFCLVSTALVSDWFWLFSLVVPFYAIGLLWKHVVKPYIFDPTAEETEAKLRSNESREDKRKRVRAEKKENMGGRSRRG